MGSYQVKVNYLLTKLNLALGNLGDENNTHSCKRWLTIFFSILKTFKLLNLVVGKVLGYFYLIISQGWMKLSNKITRSSTPSMSVCLGDICSKNEVFIHDQKLHVYSLRYQKSFTKISTLFTTKVISPSADQIYINTLTSHKQLQLESICAAGGCQNYSKLEEF